MTCTLQRAYDITLHHRTDRPNPATFTGDMAVPARNGSAVPAISDSTSAE